MSHSHSPIFLSLKLMLLMVYSLTTMNALAQSADEEEDANGKTNAYHSEEARFFLGLRSGYLTLEDVDDNGSFNLGLVGGFYVNPHVAFEGTIDYQETDLVYGVGRGGVRIPILERETVAFQAGVKLLPFSRSAIRPFMTGGLGHYVSTYIDRQDPYDRDFTVRDEVQENGYYLGCGLDLFPRRSNKRGMSFTWDTRWLFTERETYRSHEVEADGWNTSFACTFKF